MLWSRRFVPIDDPRAAVHMILPSAMTFIAPCIASMNPVVHVASELGQGGTERAIELLATSPDGPGGQRVVALDRDGPTGERLRKAGVPVEVFARRYCRCCRIDCRAWSRGGADESRWPA